MINTVYRLTKPRVIEDNFEEVNLKDKLIIRPTYLSICQADKRYFQGNRNPDALKEKLPMALIHEAIGEVIKDYTNTFKSGDNVVLIPNTPVEKDDVINENYLLSSKFRSSGYDGFMSEYVVIRKDRVIKLPDNINLKVASFIELVSVAYHAISRFKKFAHKRKDRIGVWGDGNLGFITSLLLKEMFPEAKVIAFGKNSEKLSYFSFADETYTIGQIPENLTVDHAFECVGGFKAEDAVNQIIDIINPEGSIGLLGVSENKIAINTRMVLEKGLNLFGSSRSGRKDFEETIKILNNKTVENYLETIITNEIEINAIKDISTAFNMDDNSNFGKTILKWNI